jgi:acetyl-CoA synthetase
MDLDRLKRELSEAIARRLNPLFRIQEVVVQSALPRTASNKIVRRALRGFALISPEEGGEDDS